RAGELYQQLKATGIEALLDDRQERAGVKFNDAELMGIPIRVTIGSRSLEKGVVEVQIRRTGEESEYPVEEAGTRIRQLLNQII
ncbi:MAG: His/Gly/Thr/Pro-type tRNA ligase C-terminal domain-containing protein, partial [Bacillota bacterium]